MTSPDIIRMAVMMYVRFPLSLRQVEDILHERGVDISYETVRVWWSRFGPMFAAEIRKKRVATHRNWAQSHRCPCPVVATCGLRSSTPPSSLVSTLSSDTTHPPAQVKLF
jgi:hypothetical protein